MIGWRLTTRSGYSLSTASESFAVDQSTVHGRPKVYHYMEEISSEKSLHAKGIPRTDETNRTQSLARFFGIKVASLHLHQRED